MIKLRTPWTRQPQFPAAVRPDLRPIEGFNAGGSGITFSTSGRPFTVGTGIALAGPLTGEISATFGSTNTGLTRAVSVTDHPFTFVFRGYVNGGGSTEMVGSIATSADALVRMFVNDTSGVLTAQHGTGAGYVSATTAAAVETSGTPFTAVAVFASPTDVRIYGSGKQGRSSGAATTAVAALGALNKLSIGVYDGSAKTSPGEGAYSLAQWLRIALTPTQAWALVDNPWQIFAPIERRIWAPSTAAPASFVPAWARRASQVIGGR